MTSKPCPYEEAVTEAARRGRWNPDLEAHRDGCLTCAELTLVVAAMAADAEDLAALEKPLPDPASIWLRAQLAVRERDFERATRAIVWIQRAAVAIALAVGGAFVPGLWRLLKQVVSGFDLSLPVAGLPRSAGSPLLVFILSLLVLGGLALWELTFVQEN